MAYGLLLLLHSVTIVAPPKHNRLIECPIFSVCCAIADLQSIAATVVTSSAAVLKYPSLSLGLYFCLLSALDDVVQAPSL
ncbi:uncharacterized protein DS421_13g423040 [Arachis hypogaea]|nr:uncharacterized protein DS421_13g423040 [Arachis hypogaea]